MNCSGPTGPMPSSPADGAPLITAVDQALQRGWRLDDLLGAADRPQDGFDDLGQALLWRIVLLTDPTPTDEPYEPFLDSAPPDKWPDTELGAGAISTAPDEIVRPEQRWAVLAGQLDERLLRQEDWPALAQLMQLFGFALRPCGGRSKHRDNRTAERSPRPGSSLPIPSRRRPAPEPRRHRYSQDHDASGIALEGLCFLPGNDADAPSVTNRVPSPQATAVVTG